MRKDWSERVLWIRNEVAKLNTVIDNLSAEVKELEETLVEIGVGVSVQVDTEDQNAVVCSRRINGKFRICVGNRPWSECNRKEKIIGYTYISVLLDRIFSEVKRLGNQG